MDDPWLYGKQTFRYHSRFFVQVGHETTYVFSRICHFSLYHMQFQTYQNYLGLPQRLQNSDFQNPFPVLRISGIFLIFFLGFWTSRPTFINKVFGKLSLSDYFIF